ncbi:hypothetical protein ACH5RR_022825 [Cinchona calisaya]|uniref:PilZ domain-containing protein n=1 Tax=Cinchona calisaya TaxID=153742 RepID=A0ABD2Z8X2_9GENT
METRATDSKAVTKDQRTLSTIEKSGIHKRGDHRLGAKAEKLKLWRPQFGVMSPACKFERGTWMHDLSVNGLSIQVQMGI